jgi:O-antigen ligase
MNHGAVVADVSAPCPVNLVDAYRTAGLRMLILGLMVGIFAFRFPGIVLFFLGSSVVVFLVFSLRRPIPTVGWLILANYAFWVLSGLISGGIDVGTLTRPEFWRGEGRSFFFYLPLLALSMLRVNRRELVFAVRVVQWLAVLGCLLCLVWLLGRGHVFQAEEDPMTGERNTSLYFVGLLTSHTGAGTFWAGLSAFLLAFSWRMRIRLTQVLAMAAVCLTLATGGRAATLGLLAAIGWLLIRGEIFQRRSLMIALLSLPIPLAGGLFVASRVPEIGHRMGELVSQRSAASVVAAAREPTLENASGYFYSGANLEHHNLVIRVYLWKYALQLAENSPMIGVGFGRFNDSYPDFRGLRHVIWLMVDGERNLGSGIEWEGHQLMVSTGNAHNSYLHVTAETGLLGLALFLALWRSIWVAFRTESLPACDSDPFLCAYANGCQSIVVSLLVAALAGHALCAPTGGILAMTLLGAWIGYRHQPHSQKPPHVGPCLLRVAGLNGTRVNSLDAE